MQQLKLFEPTGYDSVREERREKEEERERHKIASQESILLIALVVAERKSSQTDITV